jgi:hypothetical protein
MHKQPHLVAAGLDASDGGRRQRVLQLLRRWQRAPLRLEGRGRQRGPRVQLQRRRERLLRRRRRGRPGPAQAQQVVQP